MNKYDNEDCMTLARLDGLGVPENSPRSGDSNPMLGQKSKAGVGDVVMRSRFSDYYSALKTSRQGSKSDGV